MKKSELYLLFSTVISGVAIFLVALFYYIKPANIDITYNEISTEHKDKEDFLYDNSWINKISKQNQSFAYPTIVYKLQL